MRYYPVFLDLKGRKCCVVGGGRVAARKVRTLCAAGARVLVVSPVLCPALSQLKRQRAIRHAAFSYRPGVLAGACLAIAATDDRAVNSRVAADARSRLIPVNVVDVPVESTFIAGSCIARGDLVIAISTSGTAPLLAKKMRQDLQGKFLPRYGAAAKKVARARLALKACCSSAAARKARLENVVRSCRL